MGLFSLLKEKSGPGDSIALAETSTPTTRAKSAFFSGFQTEKHTRFEELEEDLGDKEPSTPALLVRQPAKSFTAGANRTIPASGPVDARGRETHVEGPSPRDARYTSIEQFQQMVELYRGSISTVYRATCTLSKWPVIIKAYQKSKMKEKNFLRMEREVRLMWMMGGEPSVVQLFNVFENASYKYLIMEMCKGGDLFKAMLLRGGHMEEQWACAEIVVPLLRILVKLHAAHILHRDIKPENIFLTGSQRFKLGDFGLAIQSDLELPFTRSGTLDYLSPEVLANPTCELQEASSITHADLKQRGVRAYDEKVDCWAVGVLAYELVVGRPPFEVKDEAKTASAIMYKNDFPLPPKHSTQWANFVTVALQKNPALRPSAAKLLEHPWVTMHAHAEAPEVALPNIPTLSLTQPHLRHSQTMRPVAARAPSSPLASKEQGSPKREMSGETQLASRKSMTAPRVQGSTELKHGLLHLPSPLGLKTGKRTATATSSAEASPNASSTWSASDFASSTDLPTASSPLSPLPKQLDASQTLNRRPTTPSRLKNGTLKPQLEMSGNSFTSLLARAPTGDGAYIDSGNILDEHERRAGGMRLRMKHYFKRQA